MSESHQFALQILFGGVFFIFISIVGVLVLSRRKSQRLENALSTESTKREENKSAAAAASTATSSNVIKEASDVSTETKPTEAKSLKTALAKTRSQLWGRISTLFTSGKAEYMEELEEILYTSDIGPKTVQKLLLALEDMPSNQKSDFTAVQQEIKKNILNFFVPLQDKTNLIFSQSGPTVYMIVGVNGVGKTTTIGKLAAQAAKEGKKVLVAAGDTFRAAAGAQLKVWSERAQVEIFSPEGITDPGAVAHDAVAKAVAQSFDLVLIDTAGRLHTQNSLMDELKKVKRVIQKQLPEAPHEVIIVLDSNSGQNAMIQAQEFNKAVQLTGVVLTKMDGTAKGGVALGLADELKLPIKKIGIGEGINDLKNFESTEFVDAIF